LTIRTQFHAASSRLLVAPANPCGPADNYQPPALSRRFWKALRVL
jgi:hypothetical protein